jgi:hypothetical protein
LTLGEDVLESLNAATRAQGAIDAALSRLRDAVASRRWDAVEAIREELREALDLYVDNYCAAGKRLEHEVVRGAAR